MSIDFEQKKEQLLSDGYLLTQKVALAIASTKALRPNLIEILTRKNIRRHKQQHDELFHEFIEYDRNVSLFIPVFDAPSAVGIDRVFTFYTTYSSQLCQPRDNLRALLNDYSSRISSLENEVNSRITIYGMVGSLLVALLALYVSWAALTLTSTATGIAIRQDETNRLFFSKAAKLELYVKTDVDAFANFNISFLAHNTGNKAPAPGFYYRVIIPAEIIEPRGERLGNADNSLLLDANIERLPVQGKEFMSFGGFTREPIFPGRKLRLGNLSLKMPLRDFKVEWQFTTEDGVFPSENKLDAILIAPTPKK